MKDIDLSTRKTLWTNPNVVAEIARRDLAKLVCKVLAIGMAIVAAVWLLSSTALADDFECVYIGGCTAILPCPEGGSKVVRFREGDKICECAGYIVNPEDGWRRTDLVEIDGELWPGNP